MIDPRQFVDIPVHPAADLFPMIEGDAFVALVNDIKARGQETPVIVWNGAIVDGRNRYAACKYAGVKPKTKQSDFKSDTDAVRYIISTNIHRRHLTDEQRDQIGARLVTMHGQGGDRKDQPAKCGLIGIATAAAMVSSTTARIERARQVERAAPELAEKVIRGEISKGQALKQVRARQRQATPQTDPDRADDAVMDKKIERAADGYTPKMEKVWAAYSALDAVEQTAFKERLSQ